MTPGSHHHPARLRPGRLADLPALLVIEHASFLHAGERFTERTTRCLLRNRRAITIVAELDGKLLGWAAGFGSIKSDNPWGRVYALAIHPDARGRKLGERLLRHIIEALTERGARRIFLEVRPENHPAVRLYEKAGFAVCQRLEHFYAPGAAAQRMRLDLPPSV